MKILESGESGFRESVDNQNDRRRVEFYSHYSSSVSDQLIIPKNLSHDEKDIRRERDLDFLKPIKNYLHFLERVITGDEFRV